MNNLGLCQRLRRECGISGTGPASVEGQTGEMGRLVGWIDQAVIEIETSADDFYFMMGLDESLTTSGKNIAAPDDFAEPIALVIIDDTQLSELKYIDPQEFDERLRTTIDSPNKPSFYTVKGSVILFNCTPDQAYSIKLEYTLLPAELTENEHVPRIPERFRMVIVYKAMEYYAHYENAPEVASRGKVGYDEMYAKMCRSQRPPMTFAGPVA